MEKNVTAFIEYLKAQVGEPYLWGGQHTRLTPENYVRVIERKEAGRGGYPDGTSYAQACIDFCKQKFEEGATVLYAYDCSGLIMAYLQKHGHYGYDMSSRSLYKKCRVLAKGELRAGYLVFRHNGVRIFHVGAYMGAGRVIEAKGRDDGVVERDVHASGTSYWNRFGRLPIWEGA